MSPSAAATLYLCYFGLRQPLVQTQVLPYLRKLAEAGFDVHLLTFEPQSWVGIEAEHARGQLRRQGVHWHTARYHKTPRWLTTPWDMAVGTITVLRLSWQFGFRLIHARSHVPLAVALAARLFSRSRVLFDLRGLMAEEYADAGIWSEASVLFKAVKFVERLGLRHADAVVVLTERMRSLLLTTGFADPDRLEVIPCCTPAAAATAADVGDRDLELIYAGSVSGLYLLDDVARFAAAFRSVRPEAGLRVLTQEDPTSASARLKAAGLPPDSFSVESAEPSEVAGMLRRASAGLSFRKATFSQVAASPTKAGEYLGAGLPVVTNSGIGDLDDILRDHRVGVVVADASAASFLSAAKELASLLRDPDLRERCRRVALRYYDLDSVGAPRYRRVYERLCSGRPG